MHTLLKNLFDFEREETPGEVLFYRFFELVMTYWVLYFAWKWGFYILRIRDVVLPLGLAAHVDVSFMFGHGLSLVNAAAITGLMGLGLFRRGRFAYLGALALMHLQYVARFSLGEISHGSNVIGMALLAMGLGAVLFRDRTRMHRFVFGFLYFFLGLGYVSAATCKLVASGPLWVDGTHLWLWIAERTVDTFSLSGTLSHNALQELILASRPLGTAILTFGLLTEALAFLMWFRRTRPWVMTLLIMMHVGILLSMKINFPANNVLLLLLAYPWGSWIDRGLAHLNQRTLSMVRRISLRLA